MAMGVSLLSDGGEGSLSKQHKSLLPAPPNTSVHLRKHREIRGMLREGRRQGKAGGSGVR